MGCEYLHEIPEGKQVELTLATAYFPFFIGSECIILLRSSGVNLNEEKTPKRLQTAVKVNLAE